MNASDHLAPLIEALGALSDWLNASSVSFVLVGGVAASILGRPRLTRDIDVLVEIDQAEWAQLVHEGEKWDFVPRLADALEFARESRVLLMRHVPSRVDVDIILAGLPFEQEIIERSISMPCAGIPLPVASVEDLIIMKCIAQRPRDIADIEGLLQSVPSIDWGRVEFWTEQFAALLDASDILRTLERLRSTGSPE